MEIAEIKSRLAITQVARHLGIEVNPRTMKALCPFHDDKTPSLQFSKEKQICTCFSSNCDAGTMDVISLTQKKLNLSTHETLKYLSELAGEAVAEPVLIKSEVPSNTNTESSQAKDVATLKKVYSYFETSFLGSKPAKDYAIGRKLDIKTLSIGYNKGTFHHGEKSQGDSQLLSTYVQLGLLHKTNSGYSSFGLGSLVFALRDKQQQVTGLYFRAVEPRPNKVKNRNYEKHLYLKNRSGLYPSYPNQEAKRIILTESIIDAATLLSIKDTTFSSSRTSLKINNDSYQILALYGTNGLTKEHIKCLSELPELAEIILWLDGDAAGKAANAKHAKTLQALLPTVTLSVVEMLENEDINSLTQGHQSVDGQADPGIFTQLLKERKPFVCSTNPQTLEPSYSSGEQKNHKPALAHHPSGLNTKNPNTRAERTDEHLLNTTNANKITYITETARYSIKGGIRKDLDSLKVTLVIEQLQSSSGHYALKSRNKIDLYEDKQTEKIARESAEKLKLRADLIENDLNMLTDLLDEYREDLAGQAEKEIINQPVAVPTAAKENCIRFLKSPKLLARINELIGKSGVVGEQNNRIFLFGIASSYKMPSPLHALIQGSTGSGKTHLLSTIIDFMPPEDTLSLTRVTESSLYNYGEYELQHKLIGLEDLDGLEEKAELAFRELQSKGMISSSTSGKNEQTGQITGYVKKVYGPIASLSATTKGDIYEDNMSRCFLVAVDESQAQTRRIIQYQNQRAAGRINKNEEKQAAELLRNCMRLLQPLEVINPYADKIHLPQEAHKIRRLNDLFQSYVKQVTLLNQYQRQRVAGDPKTLITAKEDLRTTIEIMFDSILLKVDELDGSLRDFYEKLKHYVLAKGKEYEFEQREIRQNFRISKSQMQRNINNLLELEYIVKTYVSARNTFHYKIAYWDNMEHLRNRIKQDLNKQLEKL